ncbi:MAG: SPOR domain-containing protein, partial [Blastocatellia bacterium]|nr:SPOR domain-containing protein [Blastocatellia bacterium]
AFAIQIAATTTEAEAQSIVVELKAKGIDAYLLKAAVPRKGTRYRVRFGRFSTQIEAKAAGVQALSRGIIKEFIITAYDPPAVSLLPPETKSEHEIEEPKTVSAPLPDTGEANETKGEKATEAEAPFALTINNRNWRFSRRAAQADKDLRAVFFVDTITGWAAGDSGAVYRTTDGGRTWKPLLSGAAADIDFIFFADWSDGWMLGGPLEGEGRLLFMTNNGGRSWNHKPLPNVVSLHFIDPLNGWAVGNGATILKTTDGGERWSPASGLEKLIGLPIATATGNFGLRDVYFLDAGNGWVIGNFYGTGTSSIGGLFATEDGGNSWRRVPLLDTSGRPIPGELQSVRFTDVKTGSVTGEVYDGDGRFFFVLQTRDGGQTWEQHRLQSRAAHRSQFIDLATGWSIAAAPRSSGAETIVYDTTLIRTDNGGKSWEDDFVARGGRIRQLFFLSRTRGWAVGDHGLIMSYDVGSR